MNKTVAWCDYCFSTDLVGETCDMKWNEELGLFVAVHGPDDVRCGGCGSNSINWSSGTEEERTRYIEEHSCGNCGNNADDCDCEVCDGCDCTDCQCEVCEDCTDKYADDVTIREREDEGAILCDNCYEKRQRIQCENCGDSDADDDSVQFREDIPGTYCGCCYESKLEERGQILDPEKGVVWEDTGLPVNMVVADPAPVKVDLPAPKLEGVAMSFEDLL